MEATVSQVKRLTAGWRHLPRVEVVSSPGELPVRAPDDTRGLFHRGEVFIVDQPADDVARVLGHELVAHAGLRRLHGPKRHWAGFMAAVSAGARAGDPVLSTLQHRVRCVYGDNMQPLLQADEVAAHLGEILWCPERGAEVRAWAPNAQSHALKRHLQREWLLLERKADGQELVGALQNAEQLLRKGRLLAPRLWWYPAPTRQEIPMSQQHRGVFKPTDPPPSLAELQRLLRKDGAFSSIADGLLFIACVLGAPLSAALLAYGLFHDILRWL